jgi:hypothetical protein
MLHREKREKNLRDGIRIKEEHQKRVDELQNAFDVLRIQEKILESRYDKAIEAGDEKLAFQLHGQIRAKNLETADAHDIMWDFFARNYPETDSDECWSYCLNDKVLVKRDKSLKLPLPGGGFHAIDLGEMFGG